MKNWSVITIGAAVLVQIAILLGMYIQAALPLWTGKQIYLPVKPVDPRSMFRGNYAQLRYEITFIDKKFFSDSDSIRNEEVVFVNLQPAEDGLLSHGKVQLTKPSSGTFLRGRIQGRQTIQGSVHFRINYGIEALFAPKKKALELEQQLRSGGKAELKVDDNGRARLVNVIPV